MKTALLHNGAVITADEYSETVHSSRIYCIDKSCKVPVIYVPKSKHASAHFKTTGKLDSQHKNTCGFYAPMDCFESIEKVTEYQADLDGKVKESIIKLNMRRIDPDHEPKSIDRQTEDKEDKDDSELKVKKDSESPTSISSVKSVVQLMTKYEPDLLASVLFDIGGSRKVPLSSIIINQSKAHELLWNDQSLKIGYFVYGTVNKIYKREKVIYIELEEVEDITFTLVVFEKYFNHFTYGEELEGKDILVYGHLRKNEYQKRQKTEMLIKSNKYIEIIKRSNK